MVTFLSKWANKRNNSFTGHYKVSLGLIEKLQKGKGKQLLNLKTIKTQAHVCHVFNITSIAVLPRMVVTGGKLAEKLEYACIKSAWRLTESFGQ